MRKRIAPFRQLAQSLNTAEKRQFSLSTKKIQGDKAYLKLFEEALKKKPDDTENEEQDAQNRRAFMENYLYEAIMDALIFRSDYADEDSQINRMIEKLKILLYKGLNDLAQTQINKLKKACERAEFFSGWLHVLELELSFASFYSEEYSLSVEEIKSQRQAVLALQENYLDVAYAYHNLAGFLKKCKYIKTKDELLTLENLTLPARKFQEGDVLSVRAKTIQNLILKEYYRYTRDFQSALKYSSDVLTLIIPAGYESMYPPALLEFAENLALRLRCHFLYEIEKRILVWEGLMHQKQGILAECILYERWVYLKLLYFLKKGEFKSGIEFYESEKKYLKKEGYRLSETFKCKIHFILACHYLYHRDGQNFLMHANKVIAEFGESFEEYLEARTLKLIFHYLAEEEPDYLQREADQILSALSRAGCQRPFEQEVAALIYHNPRINSPRWQSLLEKWSAENLVQSGQAYYVNSGLLNFEN
ncbi:MAG: hypothetical protein NZM15_06105 [Flavobacteriales bacterium]|nr:hypothetical protein [Flavobacteriales bacterium]MDW8432257.1 hypothetical protein [Flavobacteriales bacterium]